MRIVDNDRVDAQRRCSKRVLGVRPRPQTWPGRVRQVRYHQAIVRRESRARAVSEWLTRPHRRTAGAVGKGVLVTWVEKQLGLIGFCDECPSGVDVTLLVPDLGLTFML